MMTRTAVDASTITTWLAEAGAAVRAERDHLTQLDAAIGDGATGRTWRAASTPSTARWPT